MTRVAQIDVPADSLLAEFGGPHDYRDCFVREVPGEVTLAGFVERFYCSLAFRPERIVLRLLGTPASSADARVLARGDTDRFGAWKVIGRRSDQILLESKDTNTASWFAVEPIALKQQSGSADTSSSSSAAIGRTKTPSSSKAAGQTSTSSSSAAVGQQTRLYFGSWVGGIGQSGWKAMLRPHVWYSKVLLGGVKF